MTFNFFSQFTFKRQADLQISNPSKELPIVLPNHCIIFDKKELKNNLPVHWSKILSEQVSSFILWTLGLMHLCFHKVFMFFLSNIVVRKCVFNENAGVQIYLLIQNFKPLRSIRIIAIYNICLKQGWIQDFLSFTQLLKSSIYWTSTQSLKKELNVITQQNNKIHCVFHKKPDKNLCTQYLFEIAIFGNKRWVKYLLLSSSRDNSAYHFQQQ